MSAVSIGVLAERVVARTSTMMAFQEMLRDCPTQDHRRRVINCAWTNGAISDAEHQALIREAATV